MKKFVMAALGGTGELVGRVTTALGQMQAKGKASAEADLKCQTTRFNLARGQQGVHCQRHGCRRGITGVDNVSGDDNSARHLKLLGQLIDDSDVSLVGHNRG